MNANIERKRINDVDLKTGVCACGAVDAFEASSIVAPASRCALFAAARAEEGPPARL